MAGDNERSEAREKNSEIKRRVEQGQEETRNQSEEPAHRRLENVCLCDGG